VLADINGVKWLSKRRTWFAAGGSYAGEDSFTNYFDNGTELQAGDANHYSNHPFYPS